MVGLFVVGALLVACEEPPPTVVPGPAPVPVALEVRQARWTIGRKQDQASALRIELERRNMRLVSRRDAAVIAWVDDGLPNYARVVDMYVLREQHSYCVARIRIPDPSFSTHLFLAGWLAEILARAIVSPPHTLPDASCASAV
jgi:hypothetical protein